MTLFTLYGVDYTTGHAFIDSVKLLSIAFAWLLCEYIDKKINHYETKKYMPKCGTRIKAKKQYGYNRVHRH